MSLGSTVLRFSISRVIKMMCSDICESSSNIYDPWVISQKHIPSKPPLKSMANFIFLKFGMVEPLKTLQTVLNVKINILQIKIFDKISVMLFVVLSNLKY